MIHSGNTGLVILVLVMIVIAYVAGYWAGMRKITDKLHEILPFEEYRNLIHMMYADAKNEEDK